MRRLTRHCHSNIDFYSIIYLPRWMGWEDHIGEITALKRQDMSSYAQETLERVACYVLPIMRKQGYRVRKLAEFLPKNECLLGLNVNRGQRISLRLRKTSNPQEFLPFESVLGTMLHELCHNTYGPHNDRFFQLLGKLTEEMEDMMAKGFKGDPFIGRGNSLGQGNVAPAARPAQPARKRSKGRKLGGLARRSGTPLRELVLEAAERRRQADLSCKIAQKLSDLPEDEQSIIDLTDEKPQKRIKEFIDLTENSPNKRRRRSDAEVIVID